MKNGKHLLGMQGEKRKLYSLIEEHIAYMLVNGRVQSDRSAPEGYFMFPGR